MIRADLGDANLSNADLVRADLRNANLAGTNFGGADLQEANLGGADLTGAALGLANFGKADLGKANLRDAVLKGANFHQADLSRADLTGANLTKANLRSSNLRGADFTGANFDEADLGAADVSSLRSAGQTSSAGRTNFSFASKLDQSQLEKMTGDTGVILPAGLVHPDTWPKWDGIKTNAAFVKEIDSVEPGLEIESQKTEANTDALPFVFLSYSSADHEVVKDIRTMLISQGIACWWDRDIQPGGMWRASIDERLDTASVILTFWTEQSCHSTPVIEEASRAQKKEKLIHARMDDTKLPYGFSETQYQDLRTWDGSTSHEGMRRLIQAIRDKLNPPTRSEIERRVIEGAPVTAINQNGKIAAKDSPPQAVPPVQNPEDLELRLAAQTILAEKIVGQLDGTNYSHNLSITVFLSVQHYQKTVKMRPAAWYILSDATKSIRHCTLEFSDEPWPGTTLHDVKLLCDNNDDLRPLLQPVQPSIIGPDARPLTPAINPKHISDDALNNVVVAVDEILTGESTDDVFDESVKAALKHYKIEISLGQNTNETGERAVRSKLHHLRLGLVGLAGVVGSISISLTSGVANSMLTSPNAAHTILSNIKSLFGKLIAFF